MKREERLQKKHAELQEQYELASEKVRRLATALIVETDPSRHFQMEQQLQQAKSLRDSLEQELDRVEREIDGLRVVPPLLNERVSPKDGKVMVRVPAGSFLYGDDKKSLALPEFWIDKSPVTNAEYKRFIDGAYPKPEVPYVEEVWAEDYNWDRQTRMFPDFEEDSPVVLVSWHDAWAYARWAGKVLPTEQQWEKAARGPNGRKYPWGDHPPTLDLCHRPPVLDDFRISTYSVGSCSPQGDSPYGCQDMIGNVWEWTNSDYDAQRKVLRGGAWNFSQDRVRAAFRYNLVPTNRIIFVGFRCAQE